MSLKWRNVSLQTRHMQTKCFFLFICSEITNCFQFPKQGFNIHFLSVSIRTYARSLSIQVISNIRIPTHSMHLQLHFHILATPPCSDTFCLTPNKDVTLRCRERPPMLNALLSCTDLSQFVSLRKTVSSFHSASRRWLRHLPSPKYTFLVHTWQEEREVVTKASVVFLKYDHLERRKIKKKKLN